MVLADMLIAASDSFKLTGLRWKLLRQQHKLPFQRLDPVTQLAIVLAMATWCANSMSHHTQDKTHLHLQDRSVEAQRVVGGQPLVEPAHM